MLHIILAFCALWVTFFVSWFLYNLIKLIRKFNQTVEEMREQIRHVEHAIHGVRVKFDDGTSAIKVIAEFVKTVATKWVMNKFKDKNES